MKNLDIIITMLITGFLAGLIEDSWPSVIGSQVVVVLWIWGMKKLADFIARRRHARWTKRTLGR